MLTINDDTLKRRLKGFGLGMLIGVIAYVSPAVGLNATVLDDVMEKYSQGTVGLQVVYTCNNRESRGLMLGVDTDGDKVIDMNGFYRLKSRDGKPYAIYDFDTGNVYLNPNEDETLDSVIEDIDGNTADACSSMPPDGVAI